MKLRIDKTMLLPNEEFEKEWQHLTMSHEGQVYVARSNPRDIALRFFKAGCMAMVNYLAQRGQDIDALSVPIYCICGSQSLEERMAFWADALASEDMAIVFKPVFSRERKQEALKLHRLKIKLAQKVFIVTEKEDGELRLGKYTQREIEYAKKLRKPIHFLT